MEIKSKKTKKIMKKTAEDTLETYNRVFSQIMFDVVGLLKLSKESMEIKNYEMAEKIIDGLLEYFKQFEVK